MSRLQLMGLIAATGLLLLLVWLAEPAQIWQAGREVNSAWLLGAVLLNLPVVALLTWRSTFVLKRLAAQVPLAVLTPATILGIMAGGLTPAASGDLLRAQALHRRAGVPLRDCLSLVLYEHFASFYLLLVFGAALLCVSAWPEYTAAFALGGLASTYLPYLGARMALRYLPDPTGMESRSPSSKILRHLLHLAVELRSLLADAHLTLSWSLCTAAINMLMGAQIWLLTKAIAGSISLSDSWLAMALSQLAGIVSLLPWGLGVSDGSLAAILGAQGLTLQEAYLAVLLSRAIITLPLGCAAYASYLLLELRIHPLGAIVSEPQRSSDGTSVTS